MAGGDDRPDPTRRDLRTYLKEVDEWHPRASLHDSGGRTITYWVDGRITYTTGQELADFDGETYDLVYDVRTGFTRRLEGKSPRDVMRFWKRMMRGDYEWIEDHAWIEGSISEETEEAFIEFTRQAMRDRDQAFLHRLGPEIEGEACKKGGCERARVKFSVFCRVHHFENLHGRLPLDVPAIPPWARLLGVWRGL